jgi:hypothetical protein
MDAQTRIKLTLGDLMLQLSIAHARIEELEEQIKQQDTPNKEPAKAINGGDVTAVQ